MKRMLIVACLLAGLLQAQGQILPDYDTIKLELATDYKPAEKFVLAAADFILNNPVTTAELKRAQSLQFIFKWMEGTPNYSFVIDSSTQLFKYNLDMMAVYIAAMCKYCLTNPALAKNPQLLTLNAWKLLLAYCANDKNKLAPTKQVQKLIEADKNGTLEKELEKQVSSFFDR
jgi:hypothetical protein